MNEELLKALELALEKRGLNKGLTKYITVTKEEEIEGAINDYAALAPPTTPTTAQMLENADVKKEIDRRVTAAVTTNTANLAKKHNFDPAKEPEPKNEPPANETPAEKALREKYEALEEKFNKLEEGKTAESKQAQVAALLKGSKLIPDNVQQKWLNRFDLNSETPFEEQLKALETEYTEIVQANNNSRQYAGPPKPGESKDTPPKEQMDKVFGKI